MRKDCTTCAYAALPGQCEPLAMCATVSALWRWYASDDTYLDDDGVCTNPDSTCPSWASDKEAR